MATVPTFLTFVAGSVLTAAQLNSNVRDAGNFWLTVKPALETIQASPQAIGTSTWTSVTFDTDVYDNDGMHSTVTNPSRATAVTAGRYLFLASLDFALNASGLRAVKFLVNGTTSYAKDGQLVAPTSTDVALFTGMMTYLSAADYVELQCWQSSGGSLNTGSGDGQPRLQAMWLANA